MKIYQLIEELEWCNKNDDIVVLLRKKNLDSNDGYFVYDVEECDFDLVRYNDGLKFEITTSV